MTLALVLCLDIPAYAAFGWNPQVTPEWNLYGVAAASTTDVWGVGGSGLIAHTTDGGTNWSSQGSGTTENLYDISAVDSSSAWAVGGHTDLGPAPPATITTVGVITRTTNGGTNWSSTATSSELHGVSATSPSNVWAVGLSRAGVSMSPVILHSTDGINWNPEDPGSDQSLWGVCAVDGNNAWAVGQAGTIIHTANGGASWQEQTSGTSQPLNGVTAVSPSEAWVVGDNGVILHTTDGGLHWDPQTSNVTKELYRISAASPRDLWAVGYQDTSVHTTDGGATWTPYLGSIQYFNSVSAVETGDAWGVGATIGGDPDVVRWSQGLHVTNLSEYAAACGSTITISGTDFGPDPGTHASDYVRFGAFVPGETDYVSWNNNYIQVRVPADAYGVTNVFVHTGGLASNALPLTVVPEVSGPLDPTESRPGEPVTITGTGFGPTQGDASGHVFFGTTESSVSAWSDISITAVVPVIPMGATTVRVNAYGSDSNAEGFTVTGFTLTPSSGPGGSVTPSTPQTVAYGGSQTFDFTPNAGYHLGDVKVDDVSVGKPASYTFTNVTADHEVVVTFEKAKPIISAVSPASGPYGTEVTVTGSNFGDVQGTSIITLGGVPAPVVSWSDTKIVITVPGAARSGAVVVTTPAGGSNTDKDFTVTASSAWYLAEGTNAWGFSAYITLENPNDSAVTAKLTYMNASASASGKGIAGTRTLTLPPLSQTCVSSVSDIGMVDFSTRVECLEGKTIAVDRTMYWTGPGYSSSQSGFHSSMGVTSPSITWYLPEGSSNWGFETWTLVENPSATAANITLTYMTEGSGAKPVKKTVPPYSRATYSMSQDIGGADSSIQVTSDIPVIAERSVYRNNKREGSCSLGATSPASDFFLAEGATGYNVGYVTYVLVQNPQNTPTDITLTYQTQSGEVQGPSLTMPPNSRKTIRLNDQLPANTNVSTKVHGSQGIIAERAMYWDNGTGQAFHTSIGLRSPHLSFYLPDGNVSSSSETWTLVENPNPGAVTVEVTYLPNGGGTPISFTDEIAPGTRATYSMKDKIPSGRAAIMVQSLDGGRPVMVERSMYMNNRGGGTDTIGGFTD
ncbi:MAG: IPT/TIG domain-containing protein [Candidatus Geothermincolia bacterium]